MQGYTNIRDIIGLSCNEEGRRKKEHAIGPWGFSWIYVMCEYTSLGLLRHGFGQLTLWLLQGVIDGLGCDGVPRYGSAGRGANKLPPET